MFDASGHFAQMLIRSDLPKIANRAQGTADQNKAVVTGSVAMYGINSVSEADKVLTRTLKGVRLPHSTALMVNEPSRRLRRMKFASRIPTHRQVRGLTQCGEE
jgi:hypothetical protein